MFIKKGATFILKLIEMSETKYNELGGKHVKQVIYVDEHGYLAKAKAILKNTGNLRLIGETGTGKTTLVYALARDEDMPLFEKVLTSDTSQWDLLGCDVLKEGNTTVREGLVVKWLRSKRGILYLDGFNYAQPSIVSLLECLADFRGSIWVGELEQEFQRTSEHYLIISYNPAEKSGYSGTYISNIATIRRFEGFNVDYLGINAETQLVKNVAGKYDFARKWVELASKTRQAYRESKLRTPLTTGNLINYAKMWKDGMDESELFEIARSLFPEDEWTFFNKLFEESTKIDWKKAQAETPKETATP
jgi:MoxR-like ATPase